MVGPGPILHAHVLALRPVHHCVAGRSRCPERFRRDKKRPALDDQGRLAVCAQGNRRDSAAEPGANDDRVIGFLSNGLFRHQHANSGRDRPRGRSLECIAPRNRTLFTVRHRLLPTTTDCSRSMSHESPHRVNELAQTQAMHDHTLRCSGRRSRSARTIARRNPTPADSGAPAETR
jgi:hypothetical protein